MQRRSKSLGKEESARGEEPLFKAVCSSRIFYLIKRVSCYARPASRRWTATRTQSLTREKCFCIFPYLDSFSKNGLCAFAQEQYGGLKFREREMNEGRRTAFQSGLLLSYFFIRVSCYARPASRRWTATRTQSLTREKCFCIFPPFIF